jgi:hypothetical protein
VKRVHTLVSGNPYVHYVHYVALSYTVIQVYMKSVDYNIQQAQELKTLKTLETLKIQLPGCKYTYGKIVIGSIWLYTWLYTLGGESV